MGFNNASRRSAALAALLVVCGAANARAESTDRLAKTVLLPPGMPIRIDATIADLTITGSDRTDVAVEIVRKAPSAADLTMFPARIDESPDGLHVIALQNADGKDASLRSEITVSAPASAVFSAIRIFEGRIRLTNVKGACDVDLRRGPIEASGLAGRVRLEAGIGSLEVNQPELTPGGMMRLRLFNGVVRVALARQPASARILAVTFNGTLTSDVPLTMKDKFGPRFGETTIGSGDPVMSIDVVKGDIAIRVAR